jgi:hypothetical protein
LRGDKRISPSYPPRRRAATKYEAKCPVPMTPSLVTVPPNDAAEDAVF